MKASKATAANLRAIRASIAEDTKGSADERHVSVTRKLRRIRAEAAQFKMVQVKWLLRHIDELLGDVDEGAPIVDVPNTKPAKVAMPVSLSRFLADKGGLAPHGDLKAMDAQRILVPGKGRLVRKEGHGLTLDYAREAAEEAGYLRQDSDINDLLAALAEELSGRKVFRPEDYTAYIAATGQDMDAMLRPAGADYDPNNAEAIPF